MEKFKRNSADEKTSAEKLRTDKAGQRGCPPDNPINDTVEVDRSNPMKEVRVGDIVMHPALESFYSLNAADDDALIQDIRENGLISPSIWITSDNKVYVGCRRVRALQSIDPNIIIEVFVHDIAEEEVIYRVISSNKHRKKTIADLCSEILALRRKYSPGQGARTDLRGGSIGKTDDRIAREMGLSAGNIPKILFIQEKDPKLGLLIDSGELSIHSAHQKIRVEKYKPSNNPGGKACEGSGFDSWTQPETPSGDTQCAEKFMIDVQDLNDTTHTLSLNDGKEIIVIINFTNIKTH